MTGTVKPWRIALGFLAVSAGLFGTEQERLIAEFGSFPVPVSMDEFTVIQDLQGGVYVPYIADGQFAVFRGDLDGNFNPYRVPGLEENFQNPRNLCVNPPGFTEYTAFMADKAGFLYIYILRVDHGGNLFCAGTLEAGQYGQLVNFTLGESYTELCNVYVVSDGALGFFSGAGGEIPPVWQNLSIGDERVDRYGTLKKPKTAEHYGWYSVSREAGTGDITLFVIKENGLVIRETIGGYGETEKITGRVTINGEVQYTIIRDREIRVFGATGDGFVPAADFFVPIPADSYTSPELSGFSFGIVSAAKESRQQIYGITNEDSGVPEITVLVEAAENTAADFVGVNGDHCLVLFERDGRVWADSVRTKITAIEQNGPVPVDWGRYLFTNRDTGGIRVYLVNDITASLIIHTYDGSRWNKIADISLPEGTDPKNIGAEPGISDNPFLVFPDTVFLAAGDSCAAGDTAGGIWNIITGRRRIWGRIINGIAFSAVHRGDRLIVYRMRGIQS